MAEIIAVVGAVSAFAGLADLCVKMTKSLNEMRETFVDAEGAITALHADVDAFASILRQIANRLEQTLAKGRKYSLLERMNLGNIISSCSTSLLSLQKVLCKFEDFSDLVGKGRAINIPVIKMRLRWVKEEKRIEKIQQSLEKQKSTLTVQLIVISVAQGDELLNTLEERLQRTSIDTAAAVGDIPAPTEEEMAIAIPSLRPPDPPKADPSASPTMEKPDTVIEDSERVPQVVISPNEDTSKLSQGDTPKVTQIHSSARGKAIQQQESKDQEDPHDIKLVAESSDTDLKEGLNSTVDGGEVASPSDAAKQPGHGHQKSRSPGRKRIPLVLTADALFSAIRAGNKQIVLQVMQNGVEITDRAPDGTTPLQLAVELKQEEIVLTFLFFGADPNAGGGFEVSPLIAAIGHGHSRLVKILLEAGADPRVPGVLWKAATHSLEMVKLCLAKYPGFDYPIDINAFNRTDMNGETPLSVACNLGKIDIVRFLLEDAKADAAVVFPGHCIAQFRSALHATILRKDERLIRLVLAHLPNPNLLNDPRYEPGLLHVAIDTGKLPLLQLLVDARVDLNVSFNLCGTALQRACQGGSLDMVEYLLDHHADPNIGPSIRALEDSRCPLHVAINHGSIPMVNALLAAGADPELYKGTLWLAAKTGKTEMVRRVLDIQGLHINALARDEGILAEIGGTALHIAAQMGHADVLELLLEEGADPNVATKFLGTPLDVAIKSNHQRCVDILLGVGSDDDGD